VPLATEFNSYCTYGAEMLVMRRGTAEMRPKAGGFPGGGYLEHLEQPATLSEKLKAKKEESKLPASVLG
jgi:hypothetical protein